MKRQTVRRGRPGDPCTIQDLYLKECLLGAKLAESIDSAQGLCNRLEIELPQNSPCTRHKYSRRITTWLCPDGRMDLPPVITWRAYNDDQILLDHFRVRYLEAVPLVGKFAIGPLKSIEVGAVLHPDAVAVYVSRECGGSVKKTLERLPTTLRKLGFLARQGDHFVRTVPSYDRTSVVLELHRHFFQLPATTTFQDVASHPFWRYIGVPDIGVLERLLYSAVAYRLLAKFVKSDELNQVTSAYTYGELLAEGLRMPS